MEFERIQKFVRVVAEAKHIDECWAALRLEMASFGFDKLLFASKANVNRDNMHNLFGTYILSSYGEAVEEMFIQNRGFVADFTVNWLLQNRGAISWQVNRDRFLNGEMSPQEEQIHHATRALGLTNGYTYSSTPFEAGYISGFGLCCEDGWSQEEADKVWIENTGTIETLLDTFQIVVRKMPIAAAHEVVSKDILSTVDLILEGKTNAEVAEMLGVHRRTVETRLSDARRKLDVSSTTQLVAKLVQQSQLNSP